MLTDLFANATPPSTPLATTLNGSITNSATSITVTSSTGFPVPVSGVSQFRALIESEIVLVTAVSGTTWTVVRGQEGTTGASHADTVTVTYVVTAGALGGLNSGSSRVLSATLSDVGAVNTTAETTLATHTLPGGIVAAGDILHFKVWAEMLNNSGASVTYTFRFKIGATTVMNTLAYAYTANASKSLVCVDVDVMVVSSTAQRVRALLIGTRGGNSWAASSAMPAFPFTGYGTAAEDTATDKALAFTVQMGTANSLADFTVHASSLELVKR